MAGLILENLSNIFISGTGTAFPQPGKWVTNEMIHELVFGKNWQQVMVNQKLHPDYYENELGFKERYWVHTPGSKITHDELTSADLMIAAAENAIADSGIKKETIDFVIAVTVSSPKYSSSLGTFISGKLGIQAPAIEIKAGCSSNVFSITLAAQLLQSGARNVLIAGGETNTKLMRLNPRMAYAGGDAGAAIMLSKTSDSSKGILTSYLNSDGNFSTQMGVPGLLPPNQKDLDEENYFLEYSDTAEFFLDKVWSETPDILYKATNLKASDIDCFVPHQVHKKRTLFAAHAAGIPMEKTINIIGNFANCGSVTLLVALDTAKKQEQFKDNNTVLIVAAGGGISWGGIILKT